MEALTLARSSDISVPLSVRIITIDGLPSPTPLYIVLQIYSLSKPLTPPLHTPHHTFSTLSSSSALDTVQFPIAIRDLPLDAQLTCTVHDDTPVPRAASTLSLFGSKRTLRKGKQRLYLWPYVHASSHTPSKVPSHDPASEEMGRLEKLVKKHEKGDLPRINWLDSLSFRQIEQIHSAQSAKTQNLYLYLDLPRFDFPVVYSESSYPAPLLPSAITPTPAPNQQAFDTANNIPLDLEFTAIIDPEIARENLVEAKHRRLVRSYRSGPLDRELKPNAKIRDDLNQILRYPPTYSLSPLQRDLIWRFRFYLSRDKRGLTKFLKSVEWSDQGEVKQAVDILLPLWTDIEMDDVLELLGPGDAFRDRRVRAYAVKQMSRVDDDELMLYLLQLVQALKFDPAYPDKKSSSKNSKNNHNKNSTSSNELRTLHDFLVERSVNNPILGNHFHWYLMIECGDRQFGKMYSKVAFDFMSRIVQLPNGNAQRDILRRQGEFVAKLSDIAKELRFSKDSRQKKIERLRALIQDSKSHLSSFQQLPLPLDARVSITGINADTSSVFKSNLFPLKLDLVTTDGSPYAIIFKNGDDMRQDQLVIQLFTLMDRLLRKENLDLKLMPYKVLATAQIDGMIQFVPSKTIGAISSEYGGSVLNYLRAHNPDEGSVGTYGVSPLVLETYIKSCAGYCVVTYLLGVGDRHLDNLLVSPDGHFFHVDFGYILGRDPKPFPPAVKICKEMVDAMGGMQSPHYSRFKSLCHTAFSGLRKNASLIINLVALMVDANIPDIKLEPDKAVTKLQDKFMLDVSEEEAMNNFDGLLNEISSWAAVLDKLHAAAQYFRT